MRVFSKLCMHASMHACINTWVHVLHAYKMYACMYVVGKCCVCSTYSCSMHVRLHEWWLFMSNVHACFSACMLSHRYVSVACICLYACICVWWWFCFSKVGVGVPHLRVVHLICVRCDASCLVWRQCTLSWTPCKHTCPHLLQLHRLDWIIHATGALRCCECCGGSLCVAWC